MEGGSSSKSAVIVIDVQNDFCAVEEGCALFDRSLTDKDKYIFEGSFLYPSKGLEHLRSFISRVREELPHLPLIFVRSSYPENRFASDGVPRLCIRGSKGWNFHPPFEPKS